MFFLPFFISYAGCAVYDKNNLNNIVNICWKLIGVKHRGVASFCGQQIVRKAFSI